MKCFILAAGILSLFNLVCLGKTIEETGNTVIYRTLDNLSTDSRRLAEIVLNIEKRFPRREKYVIEFTARPYKYVIVYEPQQDKFTKQTYRPLRFREQYSKRERRINKLIQRKIYIGDVRQRILRTAHRRIRDFAFDDDVVTEEAKTITYERPAEDDQ